MTPHPPSLLHAHPWSFRLPAALGLLLLMARQSLQTMDPALWLNLAGWVIVPHVFLGVWVFIRFLKATTLLHTALDTLALLFMTAGILHVDTPAAWSLAFGAVFAVAILKYALTLRANPPADLRRYARDKIRLESPAVACFFIAAALFQRLPPSSSAALLLQGAVLASSMAFAVYMIALRRAYHPFFQKIDSPTTGSPKKPYD